MVIPIVPDEGMEDAILEAAQRLERQIATVHERVACPKCGAPVGERCRAMPRGYRSLGPVQRVLKVPHKQRLRLAGISVR